MSKFYLMMLRDKDCNGKTYTFAYNMISKKLDPKLYAKLQSKFEFKTVEEAEANAREIAKQLFIYDHTKRPKVLKDFRLYRWWVLDAEKPVQVWCGCYHYGSSELDRGEFKTLAQLYPKDCCYGVKDAIVKKGKIDFSKEKDPSNGAIKTRAEAEAAKTKAKYEEWWSSPKALLDNFAPKDSKVLDLLPSGTQRIHSFGKDSLKLPEKFCFVFPTHPFKFGEHIANQLGIDYTHPRKTIWAVASYELKWFEKRWSNGEPNNYEMYDSSWKIFSSLEEAMIYAKLDNRQPQVLENPYDAPNYIQYLLGNCCGNGNILFPYKIYRLMVADGVMQPIKKFIKKKNDKKVA